MQSLQHNILQNANKLAPRAGMSYSYIKRKSASTKLRTHEHLDLELLEALESCTLAWVVAPDEASIFD